MVVMTESKKRGRPRKKIIPKATLPGSSAPDLLAAVRAAREKSTWDQRFSLSDLALMASGQLRQAYATAQQYILPDPEDPGYLAAQNDLRYWADYLRRINEALQKAPPEVTTGFEIVFSYLEKPTPPLVPPGGNI